MKTLRKLLIALAFTAVMCLPAKAVSAAPAQQNQMQVVLAQQIVNQQLAAFQAAGVALTPEQLAVIQQNANVLALQQLQAIQVAQQSVPQVAQTQQAIPLTTQLATSNVAVPTVPVASGSYVLNKNTHKFHYPTCSSVGDMSPKNRLDVNISRDQIIAQGYVPCKRCNP